MLFQRVDLEGGFPAPDAPSGGRGDAPEGVLCGPKPEELVFALAIIMPQLQTPEEAPVEDGLLGCVDRRAEEE